MSGWWSLGLLALIPVVAYTLGYPINELGHQHEPRHRKTSTRQGEQQ